MARDDYLPPDLDAKASSARRRQNLAETMLAQSLQPRQGRMAGRIYVAPSPLEGIAQVAQAWAANRAGERADTEIGDIAKEGRQRTTDELARIMTMREGAPGTPTPMGEDPNGGTVDPMPTGAVRPDPAGADLAALLSPDRNVRDIGKVLFEGSLKKSENAETRAARLQERAMTLEAQAQNLALTVEQRAEAAKLAAEARRDTAELMARTQTGIAEMTNATRRDLGVAPTIQIINTDQGPMRVDKNTGQAVPVTGPDGKPVPPKSAEKAMPASAAAKMLENNANLKKAEQALALVQGKPIGGAAGDQNATGWKGFVPDVVLQRLDPRGVDARAALADLGSMVIHDRSGAAVTAAEFPRLKPFIPGVTDSPPTVRKKLDRFVREYRAIVEEAAEFYRGSGYKVPDLGVEDGGGEGDGPVMSLEEYLAGGKR